MERTRSVIRPGTGKGQPSSSTLSTAITWSAVQLPLSRWKCHIVLERAAPTKPSSASGSWSQRASSGMSPFSPRFDRLLDLSLGEVPEVDPAPVATRGDVVEVEARLVGVRRPELRRDERVLARLVPEVVVEGRRFAAVLPTALDLERLRVEHREAAGTVSVGVAQHRDDDVVARHAVHGVRPRVTGLRDQFLCLDHLLDPRPARVACDVDDVHARRAEAGHDQVRPIGPMAG